jgi:transcriptional regulator with XRE-family HTH domain
MPPALDDAIQRRRLAFADVVRAQRTALGLSQDELGRNAGWDRIAISRIETAERSPSLDRVFRLADALGSDLGPLFDEVERAARARSAK